ncbi:MAG: AEC family transporter [Halofilum sp. (in: g-proteobacteria)]|nr:AEC family transporter [Halofilum sp. (in: g-proteobacteria)]
MAAITTALFPILVPILLGAFLKRIGFLPAEAWTGLEKLTYYVLFPSLLVHTLGRQTIAAVPWPGILLTVAVTLTAAAAALVLWHRLRPSVSGPTFTSIFQGGVRFNTYIALAVAAAFFGPEGLAMSAVAAGFMIVLINLYCIAALSVWGSAPVRGVVPLARAVLGNPLIVACALGWTLSLSGIGVPGVAADVLEVIGRAALPFGLLAVGAALQPEAVRGHLRPALVASVVQFGLKPLLAALLIGLTGLTGAAAGAVAIALVVPTATSSYILARQLGGDAPAMASIVTFQTLAAFVVMPAVLLWLGAPGLP